MKKTTNKSPREANGMLAMLHCFCCYWVGMYSWLQPWFSTITTEGPNHWTCSKWNRCLLSNNNGSSLIPLLTWVSVDCWFGGMINCNWDRPEQRWCSMLSLEGCKHQTCSIWDCYLVLNDSPVFLHIMQMNLVYRVRTASLTSSHDKGKKSSKSVNQKILHT